MVIPSGTDRVVITPAPRLALDGITRSYGPVKALDGASLTVAAGEVHALLGENGAGKSTLMKIVYGLEQPDAGTIAINGTRTAIRTPREAMSRGIGMVQQHFTLVAEMTVTENVALGGTGRLDLKAVAEQIRRISAQSGLPLDPDAPVRALSVGAQQRLEIVKALSKHTATLILDEPTAVLSPGEAADLLAWTRRFADAGGAVVLIAHKLREVLSVADRVTVLRRGRTVLTASARDVTEDSLADAMLGEATASPDGIFMPRTGHAPGPEIATPAVVTLHDVVASDEHGVERLHGASLTVHGGEIMGIAAIEGAGQHELLRVIAGRLKPSRGTATLPPHVGFVPEDRHHDAVVLSATLTENVALRGASDRRGRIPWNALRETTATLMRLRDVRAQNEDVTMGTLSGGNQQKLVLGRELADAPPALVVENPTRGLDIRATAEVHAALRAARDAGTAVVLYSSDLDEVLKLADRVLVVAAGRLRDVGRDRDAVGLAMLAGGE